MKCYKGLFYRGLKDFLGFIRKYLWRTDGVPTDDISNAVSKIQQLKQNKKLTVFAVAIGNNADKNTLRNFSTLKDNMVLKVQSEQYFRSFIVTGKQIGRAHV